MLMSHNRRQPKLMQTRVQGLVRGYAPGMTILLIVLVLVLLLGGGGYYRGRGR